MAAEAALTHCPQHQVQPLVGAVLKDGRQVLVCRLCATQLEPAGILELAGQARPAKRQISKDEPPDILATEPTSGSAGASGSRSRLDKAGSQGGQEIKK